MSAAPFVSVIIPAYNHVRFVAAAVESVLAQTHRSLEVVVVDDGSTDGTAEVVEGMIRRGDGRLRLVRQANQGAHVALNRGLAEARGELLACLNSDDLYHPRRLEVLLGALAARGGELAFSRVDHVDERSRPASGWNRERRRYLAAWRRRHQLPTVGYALLEFNLAVTSGNLLFTRRVYEAVGGFRPLRLCHDWDFLLRALLVTEPVLVDESLMDYRLHGANSFQKLAGLAEAETYACLAGYFRRIWSAPPANPRAPCAQHWPRYFDWFVERSVTLSSVMHRAAAEGPAAGRFEGIAC